MATHPEYRQWVREQLRGVDGVTDRPMMGEYLLYYRGRLVGGLYDDRLLIKPFPEAVACLPDAPRAVPYPGAKPMLVVEDVDDPTALMTLFQALARS